MLKIVKQNKAVETMQIECTEVCSTEQPFANISVNIMYMYTSINV